MSQLQVTGEAKIRDIQGPVVANSGVVTALDGDASQYVRGDGTLADFPTSTGGGSSVSYYLNSSVSQGTIGGVAYRQLGKTPISGAGTDITISANGYIASYITDANDPALLEVPAGNFNCEFYFSVNNNSGNPFTYAEVYKYDGTTFTLIGTSVGVTEYINQGTVINPYYFAVPVSQSVLTITDRIAIRIYVNVDGRTVTLHTENNHLCQVVTTFSKGLTSLNNLTRQVQFLGTGTSGTDFNISSVTATHTFNLPVASASNTGKLSSTDWSTFNNKIAGTGTTNYLSKFTSASAIGNSLVYDNGTNVIIANGTTDIQGRLQVTTSGGALLLNTDNSNFAILFRNTASSNKLWDISSFNNDLVFNEGGVGSRLYLKAGGDVGIGNTTPAYKLDVSGTGRFTGELRLESTITNGTFTYTLPAATGTFALTSQLTGGTVTSVGLSSATSGVTIGSSPITTSGTITLAIATASGSQNGLLSSTDWTTFNNKLSPATADATYVSLSANQTVNGFKTFSQAIRNDSGTLLKHNVSSGQTGYTGIGGVTDGLTVGLSGSIFSQRLIFQSAGGYEYTFPAATGTIALTSNLSAYLPLTGGTLTGALTGTSATFSGKVLINTVTNVQGSLQVTTSDGGLLVNSDNSNFAILIRNTSSSNKLWDFSSFNNDFTINEGGVATRMYFQAGGNVGIGTTTPSATLSVVGNATFSGSVTTNSNLVVNKLSDSDYLALKIENRPITNSNTSAGYIGFYSNPGNGSNNTLSTGRIYGKFDANSYAAARLTFSTVTGDDVYQDVMTLKGTNVGIGTSSPNFLVQVNKSDGGASVTQYTNADTGSASSNGLLCGIDSGEDGLFFHQGAKALRFGTSDTERMRITSGGTVAINTTYSSSTYKLVTKVQTDRNIAFGVQGTVASIECFNDAVNASTPLAIYGAPFYLPSTANDTTASLANMVIDSSNGRVYRSTTSSQRFKKNINDWNGSGLDLILALKPKTFNYKEEYYDKTNNDFLGLIAEEVAEVSPYLADYENEDRSGQVENVRYANIVVPLIKATQELKIEKDIEIAELKEQIEELKAMIAAK